MMRDVFDIALELLDHEVVDAAGIPCGIVDDVDLEGEPGKALRAVAILIGPGVVSGRLTWPFNAIARRIFGNARARVPWSQIASIDERVTLRDSAASYGLGKVDRRWQRVIARIPGSSSK